MAMKKVANRRGSNIRLYKYSDGTPYMNINFGRVTATEATANRVYAQGGQSDANIVGFDDPITGTFKITTQIVPIELLALACTKEGVTDGSANWAVREELTGATGGKITLSESPVDGSIHVYAKTTELDTEIAGTVTNKEFTATQTGDITAGTIYVAYYIKAASNAQTVTFSNLETPGSYIIYADTTYKADDDTIYDEQIKVHKAMPQKAISLSYQGSGDPMSMDLTFDLMEDDNGNVITFSRVAE